MATIVEFLSNEHRCCDESFAATEEAAQPGDLLRCRTDFRQFQAAMEHHFEKEEAMLFPAFEQVTRQHHGSDAGDAAGAPANAGNAGRDDDALASGDLEDILGQAETLLILMQQHNIKEEQILYPMCDQFLGAPSVGDPGHAGLPEHRMNLPEIVVDGRGLEPPEPMERVLAALDELQPGQRVRFLIHRQPYPLYDILRRYHYRL